MEMTQIRLQVYGDLVEFGRKQSPAPNSENAIQLAYILAAERERDDFTLDCGLDNVWKGRRNGSQNGKSM